MHPNIDRKSSGPSESENQGDEWVGLKCPVCGKGTIIKGKSAYGCSRWKEGCTFRRAFMLIISALIFFGCSNEAINFKKGEQAYSMGEYFRAAQFYRKSYQGVPTKDKATRADRAYRMADCYRRINNTQNTIWLKGLIGIGLGMLPGVFLIILSFATKKVGPADGILMCCIGMFENYLSCVVIFCAASFIMAIISILLLVIKKVKRSSQLPFIPFIALAYVLKIVVAFI